MASYLLSNKALFDLSAIWEYTVDYWSEKQADKYYFMLLDTCQDLANGTIRGKKYSEIHAEILGFRTGQHILFYRTVSNNTIEIVRILHAKMDLRNRMQE